MTILLFAIVGVVLAIGVYVFVVSRGRGTPVPVARATRTPDVVAAPLPAAPPEPVYTERQERAAPAEPTWYLAFDARSNELDATSRLRLIGDLGVIGAAWCVPILQQAYEEEQQAAHRRAALTALAACRDPAARPVFERALTSSDDWERAIAADAIADLA